MSPLWRNTPAGNAPLESAEAFSQLYERSHLQVFRYIYGLLGGPRQEVEDLTAETFTRAWKARRRFEGSEQAALGWLLRIARNLVIDHSRRQNPLSLPEDFENLLVAPAGQQPEEQVLHREQSRVLWKMLHILPDRQREMLVLRYMLGWRVKDIGEFLQMPENTVSVNIRRILSRLRRDWPGE